MSQENLQTMIRQNFGGVKEVYYGIVQVVNWVFSLDVPAAILVYLKNGTVAMLVYPTNPSGIELYCHANFFFCFGGKTRLLIR